MTDTSTQIAVDQATLLRRVNRRLARRGQQMFKARSHAATNAGPWFIVNLHGSCVTDSCVELESYARKLEALAQWEVLA